MGLFRYKGVDAGGCIKKGKTSASNEADLEIRLRKMGLELISYRTIRSAGINLTLRRVRRRDLIIFCFHLQQTLHAGVPVLEGLQDLRDSSGNTRLSEVAASLHASIEGGKTLSEALCEFPGVFSDVFINLIRAGELSGELDSILDRLGANLKWQDEQAAMARKLIMYPVFTGTVITGVVCFLMLYLVPELLAFVRTTGSELPAHTVLLIMVSKGFTEYWYAVLLIPLLVVASVVIGGKSSTGFRVAFDRMKLSVPVLGPMLEKLILARLAGLFSMMYSSGITVIDCISAGERSAGNLAIERAMNSVGRAVADGKSLGDGFAASGLFPPLIVRMIRVGETTGALAPSLENVAYFYTRDVREGISRLQSMIEPVMTLLLGAIIGWVMFSVLGPVYDLITGLRI